MKQINSVRELKLEIKRLEAEGRVKEEAMKGTLAGLKEDIKPSNLLMSVVTSFFRKSAFSNNVPAGILSGILQRVLLKNESRIEHETYTIVDAILNKLSELARRFKSRRE